MKKYLFITPLLGLLVLNGCVGSLVVPKFNQKPENGAIALKSKDTAFIHKGVTTATEVVNTLGTDYTYGLRQRALAYSWEIPTGDGLKWESWLWFWFDISNGLGGCHADEFYCSHWRAFFIAFDNNNIVIDKAAKHLDDDMSLHEQLEVWAINHHAATNSYHSLDFPPAKVIEIAK